jgi:hypothetical protein
MWSSYTGFAMQLLLLLLHNIDDSIHEGLSQQKEDVFICPYQHLHVHGTILSVPLKAEWCVLCTVKEEKNII